MMRVSRTGVAALAAAALLSACSSGGSQAQDAPSEAPSEEPTTEVRYIQPGAPGEPNKVLTAEEVAQLDLDPPEHTAADVEFMQMMMVHHEQAIELIDLIEGRTEREDLPLFAERIDISQEDEIELMKKWLSARGETVPGEGDDDDMHAQHSTHDEGELMPGMLTEEEMAAIRAASGVEFDKLWLDGMRKHHSGAIGMVEDLFLADGGQEPEIFQFATHVESDQNIEISRINMMLADIEAGGDGALPDDETSGD